MMIIIREGDINAPWPNAEFYVPKILDSLGMKLFGEDAFPVGIEVLRTDLRRCLQIFVQRAWNRIRIQVGDMKKCRSKLEAAAIAAVEGELSYTCQIFSVI